ncbi:osmoprotectant transport system substrate-binding protein [Lipingzhangella halophila]|uniref:Osmoprotectant transport system substrate-binding protein n=1 Tax=Lipingzhangella halophila TaxID=1783352 RepID=A0A7W7RLD5_9ACTN|nr:ABC transporter substrate-binding protein [Lipingzhangella halophila]MBB4933668.1 osmoprotectant transport system substrate-binding protein [Lipingzhangella halophila]
MRIPIRLTAAGVPILLVLSACMGTDSLGGEEEGGSGGDRSRVVVGSTGTPESALLAEIYAQAIEATGERVRTDHGIGSREDYFREVERGRLTLVPEYNGAVLAHLDPESEPADTERTDERVNEELPVGMEILGSTPAESVTAVTVTRATAERDDLASIADLSGVAGDLVFGGQPEFESGPRGLAGLEERYDLAFAEYRPMGAREVPEALAADDIQAAPIRTADAAIAEHDLVPLEDPEDHFGAGNMVPLVHGDSVDGPAREALDAASAELDSTEDLRELNEQVGSGGEAPDAVAADWLESAGLD